MKAFDFSKFSDSWRSLGTISIPNLTLRGGDAIDSLKEPMPFDSKLDNEDELYLERYITGISYLDEDSFEYYLPIIAKYISDHSPDDSSVVRHDFLYEIAKQDFLDRIDQRKKSLIASFLRHLLDQEFSYKLSDILDLYQDDDSIHD